VDLARYRHQASVTISAPPERVWARVTDLARMGDASPVCTGCDWDDPATGFAEGAWFTGHNADGDRTWSSRCEVVDVDPGLVRWGYAVEPDGEGTRLTESWAVLDDYPGFITTYFPDVDLGERLADRERTAHEGIAATLGAIKRELEG
jgi:uncharacterized protein YndB with AHSA1/START domain